MESIYYVDMEPEIIELDPSELVEETKKDKKEDEWKEIELPKLPVKKGEETTYEIAQKWFDKIESPLAKDRVRVYVYRLWPVINRPKGSRFIDRCPLSFFSTNKLIANFGGGEYRIDVCEKGGSYDKLFTFKYTVDSTLYPPVLDLNELVLGDDKNKSYVEMLKAKGELVMEDGVLKVRQKEPQKSDKQNGSDSIVNLASVIKEMMNFATSLKSNENKGEVEKLVSLLIEQAKLEKERSSGTLSSVAQIISAVAPILTPLLVRQEDKSLTQLIQVMMEEIKETKRQNTELLSKIIESKADPIKSIKETAELMEMLKNQDKKEEEPPKTLTDKLVEKGLELMPMVASGIMQYIGNKQQQPPQASAVAATNDMVEVNNAMDQRLEVLKQSVNSYAGVIANKLLEGVSGREFAKQLCGLFGQSIWARVAQYSVDEIFWALSQVPNFRLATNSISDEQLKVWIQEFLTYDKS
jgi:hypothetical protein